MNLSQLRAVTPAQLTSSSTRFREARNLLERAADRVDLDVLRAVADGSWRGAANEAATAQIVRVREHLTEAQNRIAAADKAVWEFAEAVTAAQRTLADAERTAELERLELGEDGSVTIPPLPWPTTERDQQVRQRAAELAHQLLSQALTIATEADVACAKVLAELEAGGVAERLADAGRDVADDDDGGTEGGDNLLDWLKGDIAWTEDGRSISEAFSDSILGHHLDVWTDSDRSILERVFGGGEGTDWFGELEPWEEDWISSSGIGATPEGLFGEDVVDRVHEDGLVALPEAMWDDFYEDVTNMPDRLSEGWSDIREGWNDFTDDPVGALGGALGIG